MTIDEDLAHGRTQLTHSPTAQLDARLLLEYVLDVSHSYLIAHGDAPLTAGQQAQYHQLLQRAQKQEPIPYITGSASFFDFELDVTPAVLIPRPETEQLVETAVAWARKQQPARLVDVGSGSGCIAVALARHLPNVQIEATDISAEALQMARQNAARLAPRRIQFYKGSLLAPIVGKVEGIVANLPYVTDAEWTAVPDGVKWYEPSLALKGGPDGLDIIRQLLAQASAKLIPGGAVFLEIGWQQGTAAKQLAQSYFPAAAITLQPDLAGHDRIVVIETKD